MGLIYYVGTAALLVILLYGARRALAYPDTGVLWLSGVGILAARLLTLLFDVPVQMRANIYSYVTIGLCLGLLLSFWQRGRNG